MEGLLFALLDSVKHKRHRGIAVGKDEISQVGEGDFPCGFVGFFGLEDLACRDCKIGVVGRDDVVVGDAEIQFGFGM